MAKLFVYDAFNNRFYTYNLNENNYRVFQNRLLSACILH